MKTIKVELKNVYGRETIYPRCENALIFAELIGQKTLTRRDIEKIKKLGYVVEIVQPDQIL